MEANLGLPWSRARAAAAVMVLLALGCSVDFSFVIRNETPGPITVTYTLRRPLSSPPGEEEAPAETSQDLEGRPEWEVLETTAYAISADRKVISLSLDPGRSVRLARVPNHTPRSAQRFPILSVRLSNADSSASLEGARVQAAFEGWASRPLYVLRARQPLESLARGGTARLFCGRLERVVAGLRCTACGGAHLLAASE